MPAACIQDCTELRLDPESIPTDCELVIVPYWIGPKAFEMNLADVKRARPNAKLALYTGTSPFWDGCPWICYKSATRTLDPSGLATAGRLNFEAVDLFLVVWPRDGVRPVSQREVGMGLFPELIPGRMSPSPLVILDFFKPGWDERQYENSAKELASICAHMPNLKIAVLGMNNIAPRILPGSSVMTMPHEFAPWEQMVRLWQSSWAFVCMNESFGYPIVENLACGTKVFCDPSCEMPSCHHPEPLGALKLHLATLAAMSPEERLIEAQRTAHEYRYSGPFISWADTCRKIIASAQS